MKPFTSVRSKQLITFRRALVLAVALMVAAFAFPAQSQWTMRASMPTARDYVGFCVLNNHLYVFGGEAQAFGILTDKNEAYDPISDTWTTLAPMPQALSESGAVAVNGKILVMG